MFGWPFGVSYLLITPLPGAGNNLRGRLMLGAKVGAKSQSAPGSGQVSLLDGVPPAFDGDLSQHDKQER
jgi:hypothetical protein